MTGYFFFGFYCNIYEMKPDIFEIFRNFSRYLEKKKNSRYLEKNRGFPETYLGVFKSHNGTALPLWLFAFFCDISF